MSSRSKLDALGDVLGVTDDTRDIERPPSGRGLADVLGEKMVVDDVPSKTDGRPVVDDQPERSNPEPSTKPNSASKRTRKAVPAPIDASPTKKTSATIPVSLVQRLRDAKQKRWDLARLVSDALNSEANRLTIESAEQFLESSADEPRAISSFRLPATHLEALDEIGTDWRMNRSQVLSAVLDRQLAETGF